MMPNKYSDDELLTAARLYEGGRFDDAFAKYLILAENGSIESQVLLGWMYLQGQGVPKDEEKAFDWFLRSTKGGSAEGEFNLAKCYARNGKFDQAFEHYHQAACKGFTPAWVRLGLMHEAGRGVPAPDLDAAFSCYEKAASKNHVFGLKHMALLLMAGHQGLLGRVQGGWLFIKAIFVAARLAYAEPESKLLCI